MIKAPHGKQAVAHNQNELMQPIYVFSCKGPQSSDDKRLNAKKSFATCLLPNAIQKNLTYSSSDRFQTRNRTARAFKEGSAAEA